MLNVLHDGGLDDQTFKFFCRHLVSLNGHWQPLNKDGSRSGILQPFSYSAFVMSVRGIWVLATAGHILRDIEKYREHPDAQITNVHIVDTFGPTPISPMAMPIEFESAPYSWIAPNTDDIAGHHGLDIGIVLLTNNQQQLLAANGVVPIAEEHWDHNNGQQCNLHCIVGLPDEFVKENEVGIVILGVDRLDNVPDDIPITEYERFVGRIDERATFDLKGMSGGLIIGINRAVRDKYWIIAVQSTWLPNRRLTFGCPIRTFGQFVEEAILKIFDQPSIAESH